MWTERYHPASAAEVVGNTGGVKRLRNWLVEWQALLDREARRVRKLLLKKNKGKQQVQDDKDSLWDDDSDFDFDSDDSGDDDSMCNTMLLSGPHGSGKTCAVYALALELGYKVHEVNTSSSRNGKHILSQLQEATQSHQVSHKSCGTPVKKPVDKEAPKRSGSLVPTSFTNLFKKSTPATATGSDGDAGKKRKRHKSEKDDSPKKKRRRRGVSPSKPGVAAVDETSQSVILHGLNLSSTTLILFDEVDIVFAEDRGFLSAVQTFMSTTKVPILLTTASTDFAAQFDGRFEQITFRCPSVRTLTSHLQLICLLEGLRTDPDDLARVANSYGNDVRRCLLSLQYMAESGGSAHQTYRKVMLPSPGLTSTKLPLSFGFGIEDSQDSVHEENKEKNCDDDDDDFVTIKPCRTKRRFVIEDDNSNSVDYPLAMPPGHTRQEEGLSAPDEEARNCPAVHGLGLEMLIGGLDGRTGCIHKTVLKWLKERLSCNAVIGKLRELCRINFSFCLLYNNIHILLPLATQLVDTVARPIESSGRPEKRKRRRIQTDLYDSEASNDSVEGDRLSDITEEKTKLDSETIKERKDENLCLAKSMSAFARYYDTVSMLDTMQLGAGRNITSGLQGQYGAGVSGPLQPGVDDELPLACDPCSPCSQDLCEECRSQVAARSAAHMYAEVDKIQCDVETLGQNNPAFTENFLLPVWRGTEKFTLMDTSTVSIPSSLRRAQENVSSSLPLCTYKHQRGVHVDYLPALREMGRTEQYRLTTNTKRRFHHYFDSITLNLKDSTIGTLNTAFT